MQASIGAAVGAAVGVAVGAAVGLAVGLTVGLAVGFAVGLAVGFGAGTVSHYRREVRMTASISPIGLDIPRALLISPLDIQAFPMNIPPLKKTDREKIIRSRLKTLYPGNPGDTVFEYALSGGKRRSGQEAQDTLMVFAADKEIYELYRRTGKSLIPGTAIMSLGAAKIKAPSKLVILLGPAWAEAIRFDSNEISGYVSAPRDTDTAGLAWLSPLYAEAEADTLPVIIIEDPRGDHTGPGDGSLGGPNGEPGGGPRDGAGDELRGLFAKSVSMRIAEAAEGLNIKRARIFYGRGEGRNFNHKRLISVLLILNCASLAFSLRLVSSIRGKELVRLQEIGREQAGYAREAERLQKEIAEIRGRLFREQAHQGPAVYAIISEIDACLSNARIRNLIIQADSFSLEAEGADSIAALRALRGSAYFSGIILHQAAPSKTGGEQFSISGKVRHE
jgi:hypothetical protein